MRTALRAAMTLVTACAITPTLGTPAGAVTTCPGGEPICLYIPPGDYPVPNPGPAGPVSQPVSRVSLLRVCDSNGNNCSESWLIVPGAYVNAAGGTRLTVHFPGAGIGVAGDGTRTVYANEPTTSPGDPFGVTLAFTADAVPVETTGLNEPECKVPPDSDLGVVSVERRGCVVTVTFKDA